MVQEEELRANANTGPCLSGGPGYGRGGVRGGFKK